MSDERPSLSVVVPTIDSAWPGRDGIFEHLLTAARSVDGELVLATALASDGEREQPPAAGVRVVHEARATIFALRAAGVRAARGEIVAITEDHVITATDWCHATIAAHARHTDIDVVGGAVENASRRWLLDWASYLMTFSTFMPPVAGPPGVRAPAISNLSFKRRTIDGLPLPPGEFEFRLLPDLLRAGRVALDDGPRVHHIHSCGIRGTLSSHFHNGRSTTGLLDPQLTLRERLRQVRVRRPFELVGEVRRSLRDRPLPPRARAGIALVPVVCLAHALGEWIGTLAGPGQSPERVS